MDERFHVNLLQQDSDQRLAVQASQAVMMNRLACLSSRSFISARRICVLIRLSTPSLLAYHFLPQLRFRGGHCCRHFDTCRCLLR